MSSLLCRFRAAGAAILVALAVLGTMPAVSAAEIVVFAAASLKEALDDAVRVYGNQSGDAVKISYAASSTLAKQIESGAPAARDRLCDRRGGRSAGKDRGRLPRRHSPADHLSSSAHG